MKIHTKLKYWLGGFIAGEGCFGIYKKQNCPNAKNIIFAVQVHPNDISVLRLLKKTINAGNLLKTSNTKRNIARFYICKRDDIQNKLIPFCDKYLLTSHKKKQYQNWKKIVQKYYSDFPYILFSKGKYTQQTQRNKKIIELSKKQSQSQIARSFNITRQRVNRIIKKYS